MLRKLWWSFLLCTGLWLGGLAWFIAQIPLSPVPAPDADAIIVLTGGSGRLEQGLSLLAEAKAPALFITGVGKKTGLSDLIKLAPERTRTTLLRLPHGAITLGRDAENTIGNAEETASWIHSNGYQRILLVTSSYHMPRSLNEFSALMPDLALIPSPVFSDEFSLRQPWSDTRSRQLLLSEYHKYLAGKLRHWLVAL